MADPRVLLVSNRGPVSFVSDEDGRFSTKRGAGGLAGALDPVARRLGARALWIAAATSGADRGALDAGRVPEVAGELGYRIELLDIEPEVYSQYYDVVSNRMLWFANHSLWDEVGDPRFGRDEIDAWEHAYVPVNARFAAAVAEAAAPGDRVLFQDYHLAAAPRALRELRPDVLIFHFTHSSFSGPDALERLPRPIPLRVIEGMLGADLVGFHVHAWANNFLDCCDRIGATVDREVGSVTVDGRTVWIRTYPIPIDAHGLRDRAGRKPAQAWADRFVASNPGMLVVRADRTEPSKNIVRGFEAFSALLDRRRDLRGSTRFVACLYPSRQTMPEYQEYAGSVVAAAEAVNRRHPGAIELFVKDDYDRTIGALCVYDALLVNPLMDGMNLVAKEGPALNARAGVLILSRGAGAFEQLGTEAIPIDDPCDVNETSAALERALDMSQEQRRKRADALRAAVDLQRPEDWIDPQLDDLSAIADGGAPASQF